MSGLWKVRLKKSFRRLSISQISIVLCLAPSLVAVAQDTLRYHAAVQSGISSENYLPHWLAANRYGVLGFDDNAFGLLQTGAQWQHKFTKRLSVRAEAELLAKLSTDNNSAQGWLQQGYGQVNYGIFSFTAGRWQRTLGSPGETLSTGSLAMSSNARPFTQLLLSVPTYSNVPFTRGWLQFKGTYGHGWLGEDRRVRNALLHEKSFFLKAGKNLPINLSGGLIHLVVWAGEAPGYGQLPNDLENYWQAIRGKGARTSDAANPVVAGEVVNAVGDNMGIYELGIDLSLRTFQARVYQQTPFEDGSGNNPFNGDRLLGVEMSSPATAPWIKSLVYEYVSTQHQSGPSRPGGVDDGPDSRDRNGDRFGGRDNYYNNAIYKSGWTYQDRIIGTPLFYTVARMRQYVPDFTEPDRQSFRFNIVNNRVVAHHVGMTGDIWQATYRLLATFTKNLGTYGGINGGINQWGSIDDPNAPYAFRPPQQQAYFLLEVETHPFSPYWSLLTSLAVDTGELTHNIGLLVGLRRKGIFTLGQKK